MKNASCLLMLVALVFCRLDLSAQAITYEGNKHRVTTQYGYIDVGPQNLDWAHIYTDRSKFIFNKPIYSYNGVFSAYYNSNLTLQTDGVTRLTILKSSGRVGIGTTSPGSLLNVGTKTTNAPSSVAMLGGNEPDSELLALSLVNSGGGFNQSTSIGFHNRSNWSPTGKIQLEQISDYTQSKMNFYTYNSGLKNRMTIDHNGNVGIGTTSPSNKLEVNGTIRSKEIKVEASPWPDYVFFDSYKLRSLEETSTYIQENGHLPEVPSAAEVAENGVNLGEMNALLLKKIEELTLHLIHLNKENHDLKSEQSQELMANSQQAKQIEELTLHLIEKENELSKTNIIVDDLVERIEKLEVKGK